MFGERVLILVPHPDDELVGAAAALERLRQSGGQASALYLTTGVPASAGSWLGGRRRYARSVTRRWQEASSVARALELSIADRQMIPSRELKSHLGSSLRWVRDQVVARKPDRIWAPAYEGGHPDHDVTNAIASRLRDEAEVWEFSEYHFARRRVQSQSFIDPSGSESILELDENEQARKSELLGRYVSERRNLGYVGIAREAFRPLTDYDYTKRPHPGRCFYERFHWVPFHPRIDYCRAEDVCAAIRELS